MTNNTKPNPAGMTGNVSVETDFTKTCERVKAMPEYQALLKDGWNLNIARRYILALEKGDRAEADRQRRWAVWDIEESRAMAEAEIRHTREVCPTCGGDGVIEVGKDCDRMPLTRLCPTCGGDGKGEDAHPYPVMKVDKSYFHATEE